MGQIVGFFPNCVSPNSRHQDLSDRVEILLRAEYNFRFNAADKLKRWWCWWPGARPDGRPIMADG